MDMRAMRDKEYLGSWDFTAEPEECTITAVVQGHAFSPATNSKERKPVVMIAERDKGFICNATNEDMLDAIHSTRDTDDLVGKKIHIVATTCLGQGGQVVDCIRIVKPPKVAPAPKPSARSKAGKELKVKFDELLAVVNEHAIDHGKVSEMAKSVTGKAKSTDCTGEEIDAVIAALRKEYDETDETDEAANGDDGDDGDQLPL